MENQCCTMILEEGPGGIPCMMIRASQDMACRDPVLLLGEFSIDELCATAGQSFSEAVDAAQVSRSDFSVQSRRYVLCNGWQSWSFAGELYKNERPRRAFAKRGLNNFVDHPAEAAIHGLANRGHGKPDMVSHFFTVLRVGSARLALVSAGGATESRALPPVTYLIGPRSIRIAVFAEGGSFSKGELLARIALVAGQDYFDLRAKVAILFGEAGQASRRFAGLRFLWEAPQQGQAEPNQGRSPPIGGFETWYNHYLDIDEDMIGKDLESIGSTRNLVNTLFISRGKPIVFQIDDGWERMVGDWRPDERKFPHGMAGLAARIEDKGYIPGLWVAPFITMPDTPIAIDHPGWILRNQRGEFVKAGWNPGWGGDFLCLDLSIPEVGDYLFNLFDMIINEWGYRYLKLDFLYAGMLRGAHRGGDGSALASGKGIWEHYAATLRRLTSIRTNKAGLPVAFLACGSPIESSAPSMPLMRIGADTREHWEYPLARFIGHQGRPSAKVNMGHSLARSLLDGTLLLNDPDVVFCRDERTSLKPNEKFLIGLVARAFASQIMSSDEPQGTSAGEEEFTRELIGLYAKIGNRRFGAERFSSRSPDVYRMFSEDGEIDGIINLSDRAQLLNIQAIDGEEKPALVPAHSILLFGLP
ncbi:MAG: alpha-galactosidase [Spirochaetaceae bacterium]|nr:alpha-galactosidase [Spirochaetaceae bacterium]